MYRPIKSRRLLLPQLGACEHVGRLLTGSGVDIEVTEEDLRIAGGRSAVLLVIVGLDVDGRGDLEKMRACDPLTRSWLNPR